MDVVAKVGNDFQSLVNHVFFIIIIIILSLMVDTVSTMTLLVNEEDNVALACFARQVSRARALSTPDSRHRLRVHRLVVIGPESIFSRSRDVLDCACYSGGNVGRQS